MTITSITVLDTETADFDGGVCEIAAVALQWDSARGWEITGHHSSLCNPGRPIAVEAMAVHHITDEMIVDAPSIDDVLESRSDMYSPPGQVGSTYAAHNAEFDQGVLPLDWRARNLVGSPHHLVDGSTPQLDWIDTYRCAMHLWPESPRFSNQVLRYHLGLDVSDMPEEAGGIVHRALYDTWCTAKMLLRMLETRTPEELISLSGKPVDLSLRKVGFGKHHNLTWSQVPSDYLRWILDKSDIDDPDQLHTARTLLGRPAQGRML